MTVNLKEKIRVMTGRRENKRGNFLFSGHSQSKSSSCGYFKPQSLDACLHKWQVAVIAFKAYRVQRQNLPQYQAAFNRCKLRANISECCITSWLMGFTWLLFDELSHVPCHHWASASTLQMQNCVGRNDDSALMGLYECDFTTLNPFHSQMQWFPSGSIPFQVQAPLSAFSCCQPSSRVRESQQPEHTDKMIK